MTRANVWMSHRQLLVHQAIAKIGGYWPPLAAVARLLEEIGEFVEILEEPKMDIAAAASELADVWIISTCIANQFTVPIDVEFVRDAESDLDIGTALGQVIQLSGRLAKVVNYYGGPKKPKNPDELLSLGVIVTRLHEALGNIANVLSIDLEDSISNSLALSIERDQRRFDPSFDPSTAPCLTTFQELADSTPCTFARAAKVWGSSTWDPTRSIRHNVEILAPYLTRFCRVAPKEHPDGFVVLPRWGPDTLTSLAHRFCSLLHALCVVDPIPNNCLNDKLDRPGWQFIFSGQRLFVSVFSPIYPINHVRHSRHAMILFQPEESFSVHGIGKAFSESDDIKILIRRRFADAGYIYPSGEIDARHEARIYLLPILTGSEPVKWWQRDWQPSRAPLTEHMP
ncbi:MAG TPA: YqcI/YcgG family protein [Streptosporangiaceae bacterium]|nr:YqcI/YcgG family protein [Streptosporangiaceae bacterium]